MLNPVFRRELQTVLRTWKTFWAIMLYVLCLTGVTALSLTVILSNTMYGGFSPQSATTIYSVMSGMQLGLIWLFVPAITGGAVSGERERQTFDLMLVTKMSSFSIIAGKLAASLLVVLLMIAASLPVFGIIMYYGGISLLNLLTMSLYFLLTAAMVGSLAIFFSVIFKKTVVAIILTYLVIGLATGGNLCGLFITSNILGNMLDNLTQPPYVLIYCVFALNPFMGFLSVIDSQLGSNNAYMLMDQMTYMYRYNYSGTTPVRPPSLWEVPLWMPNAVLNVVVIVVLLVWAAFLIRRVKHGRKKGAKK